MIFIDYSDKRPIYEQVIERFENLILSGGLLADEKMPSVRALAVELSINPNTIQRAYAELERRGYIYSVKGRGSFVRSNASLIDKKQEKLLEELREKMLACKNGGISQEQVEECLRAVYGKVTGLGPEARLGSGNEAGQTAQAGRSTQAGQAKASLNKGDTGEVKP